MSTVHEVLRSQVKKEILERLMKEDAFKGVKEEDRSRVWRNIFGNIAILGSSEETEFPPLELEVEDLKGQKIASYTLSDIIELIRDYRDTHKSQSIKMMTLRNICEAFAHEARLFLMEAKKIGLVTNLCAKMTKTCGRAPQVAFDFSTGLAHNTLSNSEKSVIQNLNARLYATQADQSKNEAIIDKGPAAGPDHLNVNLKITDLSDLVVFKLVFVLLNKTVDGVKGVFNNFCSNFSSVSAPTQTPPKEIEADSKLEKLIEHSLERAAKLDLGSLSKIKPFPLPRDCEDILGDCGLARGRSGLIQYYKGKSFVEAPRGYSTRLIFPALVNYRMSNSSELLGVLLALNRYEGDGRIEKVTDIELSAVINRYLDPYRSKSVTVRDFDILANAAPGWVDKESIVGNPTYAWFPRAR
uniref:Coat protein n=2 Tax=Fig latent virus 1 TaxID=641245 RepID=C6GZ79_9VIRU|nr:coat protein [Fig latent virus 1]